MIVLEIQSDPTQTWSSHWIAVFCLLYHSSVQHHSLLTHCCLFQVLPVRQVQPVDPRLHRLWVRLPRRPRLWRDGGGLCLARLPRRQRRLRGYDDVRGYLVCSLARTVKLLVVGRGLRWVVPESLGSTPESYTQWLIQISYHYIMRGPYLTFVEDIITDTSLQKYYFVLSCSSFLDTN